jgi:uncharacterized membrane protein YoaK (UPF0700 family)
MIGHAPPIRLLATGLAALAGFVDATGFIHLDGYFVSFMSGNSTRLAVGLASWSDEAALAGGLIASFVAGVVLGSLVGGWAGGHSRAAVLGLVAGLLAIAAGCGAAGASTLAAVAMALAMGAENAVFERVSEVRIGLTYMTGTLVRVGQRLAAALRGGPTFGWLPDLVFWAGLVGGAVAGAAAYPMFGLGNLWLAAGVSAMLGVAAWRRG